uniref:Ig-like domain-containing protein n=1 Tax=Yersinia pestis TaxID=632 RepID=UPI0039DFE3E3
MSKSADSFTWTSDNDRVATVSGTGLVTGVTPGKVKITATISRLSFLPQSK